MPRLAHRHRGHENSTHRSLETLIGIHGLRKDQAELRVAPKCRASDPAISSLRAFSKPSRGAFCCWPLCHCAPLSDGREARTQIWRRKRRRRTRLREEICSWAGWASFFAVAGISQFQSRARDARSSSAGGRPADLVRTSCMARQS